MTAALKMICECDLRHRAWNPNTGRCETCGSKFEDRRPSAAAADRPASEEKSS